MGFLDFLGPIAAIGAAPFTGGASLAMLPATLSGAGASMAGNRAAENQAIQQQNSDLSRNYSTQQQAVLQALGLAEGGTLARAKLGIEAPQTRTSQLIRGSLLANLQPAKIQVSSRLAGRVPQLSGGLTPAALSAAARTGGAELQRQALLALLSGSDIPKMPNYSGAVLSQPKLGEFKKPGALEQIMGGLGAGLGFLSPQNQGNTGIRDPGTTHRTPVIPGQVWDYRTPDYRG